MGLFDDLFTDNDFKIDDEEETQEEQSQEVEEENDSACDSCEDDGTCTCGGDCDSCSPDDDQNDTLSDDYCDDCGCDPCECDPEDFCDDCGELLENCECEPEEDENDGSWDTGYRKPPVPKGVWKPKHWKT